jgi:hypothetical protein
VGKPEGKRPLGKPRHRWKDGIRMDLREIVWGCRVDPVGSGWGPVPGCYKYGDEPYLVRLCPLSCKLTP